ncbi:hypothetical protein KY349_02700 [Candidatus Woesearchaeota archaeon]|nr:hypothetical protein [Candidatus Woesearchaeota archaeon]
MVSKDIRSEREESLGAVRRQMKMEEKLLEMTGGIDLKALLHIVLKQRDDFRELVKLINGCEGGRSMKADVTKIEENIYKKRHEMTAHARKAKDIVDKMIKILAEVKILSIQYDNQLKNIIRIAWHQNYKANLKGVQDDMRKTMKSELEGKELTAASNKCTKLFIRFIQHFLILRDHMWRVEASLIENPAIIKKEDIERRLEDMNDNIVPEIDALFREWKGLKHVEKFAMKHLKILTKDIAKEYKKLEKKIKAFQKDGLLIERSDDEYRRREVMHHIQFR